MQTKEVKFETDTWVLFFQKNVFFYMIINLQTIIILNSPYSVIYYIIYYIYYILYNFPIFGKSRFLNLQIFNFYSHCYLRT
jgi:hypothetical protein